MTDAAPLLNGCTERVDRSELLRRLRGRAFEVSGGYEDDNLVTVKDARELIDVALSAPSSAQPSAGAYRWINEAVELLQNTGREGDPGAPVDWVERREMLLMGVPTPQVDLGFDSHADRVARSTASAQPDYTSAAAPPPGWPTEAEISGDDSGNVTLKFIRPSAQPESPVVPDFDSLVRGPTEGWKLWRNCRVMQLEPYYCYWVSHLTSEDLHDKGDIATVLALLHQQRDDLESDYMRLLREKQDRLLAPYQQEPVAWMYVGKTFKRPIFHEQRQNVYGMYKETPLFAAPQVSASASPELDLAPRSSPAVAAPLPSAIYVWLVPSEHMLDQPGSWRIRKWDIEPFPEATHVAPYRESYVASRGQALLEPLILATENGLTATGRYIANLERIANRAQMLVDEGNYTEGLPDSDVQKGTGNYLADALRALRVDMQAPRESSQPGPQA